MRRCTRGRADRLCRTRGPWAHSRRVGGSKRIAGGRQRWGRCCRRSPVRVGEVALVAAAPDPVDVRGPRSRLGSRGRGPSDRRPPGSAVGRQVSGGVAPGARRRPSSRRTRRGRGAGARRAAGGVRPRDRAGRDRRGCRAGRGRCAARPGTTPGRQLRDGDQDHGHPGRPPRSGSSPALPAAYPTPARCRACSRASAPGTAATDRRPWPSADTTPLRSRHAPIARTPDNTLARCRASRAGGRPEGARRSMTTYTRLPITTPITAPNGSTDGIVTTPLATSSNPRLNPAVDTARTSSCRMWVPYACNRHGVALRSGSPDVDVGCGHRRFRATHPTVQDSRRNPGPERPRSEAVSAGRRAVGGAVPWSAHGWRG